MAKAITNDYETTVWYSRLLCYSVWGHSTFKPSITRSNNASSTGNY